MSEDLYGLLEVDSTASADEIKKAYRRLARQYHPDANPGDDEAERRFKEIAQAYEILSDPDRRSTYDRFGSTDPRAGGVGGEGFTDIFEAFFGGASPFGGGSARRPSGPPRGSDLEVIVDVSLEDAVLGGEAEFELRLPAPCGACEATGSADDSGPVSCDTCAGTGQVQAVRQSLLGQMVTNTPCPTCSGFGQVIATPCGDCRGEGRVTDTKSFSIEVPAGIDSGTRLRLSGRGSAGPRGGGRGDIYVVLRVLPHDRFQRDGDDLVENVWIPVTQAALGASLDYETLDTTEELVVRPGTRTGEEIRLRGRGVPRLQRRGRGDLIVRLIIDTPTDLDADQEGLLRSFAEARGDAVAESAGWLSKIRSTFQ
jgi:molecular chaperone DnaJ